MKSIFSFVAGFAAVMFLFWCSGADITQRGDPLAGAMVLSFIAGVAAWYVSKISEGC